jgi:hypothetical protein
VARKVLSKAPGVVDRIDVASGRLRWAREAQRIQIRRWGLAVGIALLVAIVSYHWFYPLRGFLIFASAVAVFLSSGARCQAAAKRSLSDPYRTRESWEPRDK